MCYHGLRVCTNDLEVSNIMSDLVTWLRDMCGCFDVEPVRVRIGRTTYEGARYKQKRVTSRGSRAWLSGERTYVAEAIYLLGSTPAVYRRSRRVVFTGVDAREWYVTGWATAQIAADPKVARFHPFGEWFGIAPWDFEGERIDQHEETPYQRVAVEVAS